MASHTKLGELILKKQSEGKVIRVIAEELNMTKSKIGRYLQRYRATGTFELRPKKGRPRTKRTTEVREAVRKRIKRNPNRSASKMAKDFKCSERTMRRLLKSDLNLKPFKYQRRHLINSKTKVKRLKISRQIRKFLKQRPCPEMIWTDEKIFTIERSHNHQNDRLWAVDLEDIPENERSIFVRHHPAQVMVWGGVTDSGKKTPLIPIPEGVKVNSTVYTELLLTKVLPWIEKQTWEHGYCFQQDGAPAHTAKITQKWLGDNFQAFWDKTFWPPSSPDLNPMDNSI